MANCGITSGRLEPCKDNIGGVKNVYFFPYVYYAYNLIVGNRGEELTGFPATTIYKFEVTNGQFSETVNNNEQGVSYSQNLSFVLKKQDYETTEQLNTMSKIDLSYIVEYNSGKLRIGGLFFGSRLEFDDTTGGSVTDLNGYNVRVTGEEEWMAAYLDDLSLFTVVPSYLLLEDLGFLLLEDLEKIELG